MGSFNSFIQKERSVGGNIPIWLGMVRPLPVGGILASAFCTAGRLIPAGSPVQFKDGEITPFYAWQVVSVDSSTHAITIKVSEQFADILPEANDILTPVGATFGTTGAAGKVSSIAADSTDGQYVVTMTDAKLDGVSANSYLAPSAATAVAESGKEIATQPNGYLYNDIYIDTLLTGEKFINKSASGAVVNFHGEGLLINRTIGVSFKTQLKSAIPNVNLIEY